MVHVKKSDRSKPWAKKIDYKRNQSFTRKIKSVFLIYCEGKNTEPTYFKSFPVNSETSVEAIGFGRSRTALIQHIIDLASAKELLFGQDMSPQHAGGVRMLLSCRVRRAHEIRVAGHQGACLSWPRWPGK